MANRIIRESICTSETIETLTPEAEITFYRLLVNADDYGRFDGRPKIIKSRLYPLRDITSERVEDLVGKLCTAGLIWKYTVDGKPYLQITNWETYQDIRTKRSKYPDPQSADTCEQMISSANICEQMQTSASKCPSESESESISESESEAEDARARATATADEADDKLPTSYRQVTGLGSEYTDDELRKEQDVQKTADDLIVKFGLPVNIKVLDAVAEDLRKYGVQKVTDALNDAAVSDHKGGLSVKYYRAFLANGEGHAKNGRDSPKDSYTRHSDEEWQRAVSGAVIDLDSEE